MSSATSDFSFLKMLGFIGFMLLGVMSLSFFVPGIGVHLPGTSLFVFNLRGTGLDDGARSTISAFRSPTDLALADDAGLAKILRKLNASKAAPGDALQANKILHVAVLETKTSFGTNERAPTVQLDFGEAGGAAVVILTQGPVAFQAMNVGKSQRAKVVVEGKSAFDLDAPPGLLHGFDVIAYGASSAYGADAFAKRDDNGVLYSLCSMLKRWGNEYGVDQSNMRIWKFSSPSKIEIRESGLSTNAWSQIALTDVQMVCHPPAPSRSRTTTITIRR